MRTNFDDVDGGDAARVFSNGARFTGEIVEYDPAGNLIAVMTYRDGSQDGPERLYYPDGGLKEESTWVVGGRRGFRRLWHPNGQLSKEIEYDARGLSSLRGAFTADGVLAGGKIRHQGAD